MALRPLALSRHLDRDRDYYRSLVRIALPISVQGLISASLNLIDNIMVARLDETSLAAVGLANSIYFILAIALFGVSSGLTVFIAQYWGRKDLEGVRRATGLGLLVSGGLALVVAVATASFPGFFMRIFTADPAVVDQGIVFLRRIAPSYPLAGLSFMFYGSMRCTEHAKLPLWPTTIALGLNTLLNYMLIYGNFGAPKMGVQGSATATLVARVVEVVITIGIVYGLRLPAAVTWRQIFRVDARFLSRALKVSLPVVGNEGLWVLGISIYPAIYAHMGTDVIAAVTVSSTIDRLAFVLAVGMGNAAAAIVGKQIGAGRKDLAFRYGGLSLAIAPLLAVGIGAVVFLTRPYVLPWFGIQGAVLDHAMVLVALETQCGEFGKYIVGNPRSHEEVQSLTGVVSEESLGELIANTLG